jgi:hypothetical protein
MCRWKNTPNSNGLRKYWHCVKLKRYALMLVVYALAMLSVKCINTLVRIIWKNAHVPVYLYVGDELLVFESIVIVE